MLVPVTAIGWWAPKALQRGARSSPLHSQTSRSRPTPTDVHHRVHVARERLLSSCVEFSASEGIKLHHSAVGS